ncbi:MAG: hypothetical protein ACREJ3_10005, partial [Polyangiaceae bacterium]
MFRKPLFCASVVSSSVVLSLLTPLLALPACQPRSALADDSAMRGPTSARAPAASGPGALSTVGASPGHVGEGTPLVPTRPGDMLAAFAEGCFWGSEDTFRHVQ